MSFLLHRDTCAAFVKHGRLVTGHFLQHRGELRISAVTVMELEIWLLNKRTPGRYLQGYGAMMQQVAVLDVNDPIAHRAATLGTQLYGRGVRITSMNLLVAATALEHALTLVTHASRAFAAVPGLASADWLVP